MEANKVVVGRDEMDRLIIMRLDVDRYENETIPNLQLQALALEDAQNESTDGLVQVVMPDGSEVRGFAEPAVAGLKADDVVQFERFGFCRIDRVSKAEVHAYFAHR